MPATVTKLADGATDLRSPLAATLRRYARLGAARDVAVKSLEIDLDAEVERVALTPGADRSEVMRIEEEIRAMRALPLTRILR